MKILIVEHDEEQRKSMTQLLESIGHTWVYAKGCQDAVRLFAQEEPDMVIMDVALSDSDGYQCTRRIQALAPDRFVPVVLSTSIDDHLSLQQFLDCGAVDFIDEPSNPLLLRAKLNGLSRMHSVYDHMQSLRDKFQQEISFAKLMFDAVIGRSQAKCPGLHHWMIAAGHFCGDMLIYEESPTGHLNIMLGDFTGHGLAAAVGAVPASDAFFAMTQKGIALESIAYEINRKLYHLLPTGHFCAATLLSIDVANVRLEAWIGGQPPLLLIDNEHHVANKLKSEHFPLGVMCENRFDATITSASLGGISHLLLYTDGLVEARNADGEMFGNMRLEEAIKKKKRSRLKPLQGIKNHLVSFLDGVEPHDDVSVLSFELP